MVARASAGVGAAGLEGVKAKVEPGVGIAGAGSVLANTSPLASCTGTSVAKEGLGLRGGRAEGGGATDATGRTVEVCGGEKGHWPVQAPSTFAPRLINAG